LIIEVNNSFTTYARESRQKNWGLRFPPVVFSAFAFTYLEQFGGGKRTLLELLDVQASWYLARRNEITNQNDELRAVYAILRSLGRLTQAVLGSKA
jgi:hypothetical protein